MCARVMDFMGPARPLDQVAKVAAELKTCSIGEIVVVSHADVAFDVQD